MIQCLDCQDWFHQLCIGKYAPEEESDFICSTCVQKHPALLPYLATDKFSAVYRTGEPLEEAQAEPPSVADTTSQPIDEASLAAPPTGSKRPNEGGDLPPSSKPRLEPPSAAIDAEGTTCSKPSIPYNGCGEREFSIVAKKEWRGDLCRCNKVKPVARPCSNPKVFRRVLRAGHVTPDRYRRGLRARRGSQWR